MTTCLVEQWIRICYQPGGHGFDPWSGKIPHAAKPLSPWVTTTESVLQSLGIATIQPVCCRSWSFDFLHASLHFLNFSSLLYQKTLYSKHKGSNLFSCHWNPYLKSCTGLDRVEIKVGYNMWPEVPIQDISSFLWNGLLGSGGLQQGRTQTPCILSGGQVVPNPRVWGSVFLRWGATSGLGGRHGLLSLAVFWRGSSLPGSGQRERLAARRAQSGCYDEPEEGLGILKCGHVSKRNPHRACRLPIYEVHIVSADVTSLGERNKSARVNIPHRWTRNHSVKQLLLIIEGKMNPGKKNCNTKKSCVPQA